MTLKRNVLSKVVAFGLVSVSSVSAVGIGYAVGNPNVEETVIAKTQPTRSMGPVVTRDIDVNIAKEDIMVKNDRGLDKFYSTGNFMLTSAGTTPDTSTYIDRNAFKQVPAEYKDDFRIRIQTRGIKFYRNPFDRAHMNDKVDVPSVVETNDFTLYNYHYIKVYDRKGTPWYIDTNEAIYEVAPTKQFRIVHTQDDITITDKQKNLTFDLRTKTNLTAAEIRLLTQGTGLEGIEDAVVEIENTYGINALFTIALAVNESGWGSSYLARDRNNLFGICAYDSNVDAASSFGTKSDCVRQWGKLISEYYFAEGRTTLDSIGSKYASSPIWASTVRSLMGSFIYDLEM